MQSLLSSPFENVIFGSTSVGITFSFLHSYPFDETDAYFKCPGSNVWGLAEACCHRSTATVLNKEDLSPPPGSHLQVLHNSS